VTFTRRTVLATLAAAATAAAAAPAQADASTIRVGVGDQSVAMFDNPAFREMKLRQVRYFVRWDAIRHTEERLKLRAYVRRARAEGARPLVHISTDTFVEKAARRPSVARYRSDVGRLVRYLRKLGVRDFGVWNEANHKTQPTWNSPNHAALYFMEMYRAVHRSCSTRSCRVVALDVLDQAGRERYIDRFYARLSPAWQRRARFIGIHNYSDVNRGSITRTRSIIRTVRKHNRNARFWFTETGGLVGFGANFPCDPASASSVQQAERRAATAGRRVFSTARTYRGAGVQRVYFYNWFGNDCAPNGRVDTAGRAADAMAGFDAGVVRADGTPRPGLAEVQRALRSATFAR
jgi:hypothetical protein